MATLPRLMPTRAEGETFGGVTYHVDGELVPVLTVDVSAAPVYFEHHILLWKHPRVAIRLRPVAGALRRMIAGLQVFVTEASGPGMIAFSRYGPGHIVPVHLAQGRELEVREHQFLAATEVIDYAFSRVRGVSNMLFGGAGFFVDRFHSHRGDGVRADRTTTARCSRRSRAAGEHRHRALRLALQGAAGAHGCHHRPAELGPLRRQGRPDPQPLHRAEAGGLQSMHLHAPR